MEIRFKLNPKNEKDKVILDVLSGEYSPSETIKNILYKMGLEGVERQRTSTYVQHNQYDLCNNRLCNTKDVKEWTDVKIETTKKLRNEKDEIDDIAMFFRI